MDEKERAKVIDSVLSLQTQLSHILPQSEQYKQRVAEVRKEIKELEQLLAAVSTAKK